MTDGAEAKALGKTSMLPDGWNTDGSMKETAVAESVPLTEATRGDVTGRRMRIKLIDSGWGSSGYYRPSVLQEAADHGIYPAGTHMYFDHPGATESIDRPERSLRDLAAVLTDRTVYDGGALWNVAEVFTPYQRILAEMKDHIGVSIRASGTAEHGEAEGREGTIITALTEGTSVDFVTRAGRGGQIVEVLEAAREQASDSEALAWAKSQVGVPFVFPEKSPTPSVAEAETNTPAPPAQPLEETRMSGSTQPGTPPSGGAPTEVSEAAQLRTDLAETKQRLAEAELEIAKLGDQSRELTEARRDLDEARRENRRLRANDAARTKATDALAEATLPEVAHAKVIEAVTGPNVPLNDDGALDEAALVKSIKAAIDRERDYLSRFAESAGMGRVTGLGGATEPPVDTQKELGAVFASLGMSESAAAVAAKGRG